MKVLHINTHESQGGAARAAYRIHEALVKEGVDSYYYTLVPGNGGKRVLYGKPESVVGRVCWKIRGVWELYFERGLIKIFGSATHVPVSLGIGSMLNRRLIEKINPDVIHLHWVCGSFISIADIKWLAKYPLVWTQHDTWAFTGGCHYNEECKKYKTICGKCDLVKRRFGVDIIMKHFIKKREVFANTDIKVVGCSKWISKLARESVLFKGKDIFSVPNTLDQGVFNTKNKTDVRKILGLPLEKRLILFGAMNSTSDRRKGFQYLQRAIQCLRHQNLLFEFELMIFGSDEPENPPQFEVPVHYMGRLADDLSLSILYSAADVMLVPSMYENFPNTGLEAMCCGTPVVAFRIGGLPDQIDHMINGYLANPYDSEDLAKGIAYILEDIDRLSKMSEMARIKTAENFNEKKIAEEYMNVYENAMRRS